MAISIQSIQILHLTVDWRFNSGEGLGSKLVEAIGDFRLVSLEI